MDSNTISNTISKNAREMFSIIRDIQFLENWGRFTALVPIHKKKSAAGHFQFNYLTILVSILVITLHTLWLWDDLKLSYFTRNSDKIHYTLFQLALLISSSSGRTAFLIATPFFYNFFRDAKAYLKDFFPLSTTKVHKRRYYKIICLTFLNFIYFIQTVEYLIRYWTKDSKNILLGCNRFILPCENSPIVLSISFVIIILSSSTLYYLTYFVIAISDLLIQILNSFEIEILSRLDMPISTIISSPTIIPSPTKDIPLFLMNRGIKEILQVRSDTEKKVKEPVNLHEQFSMMRNLFNKFNAAIGIPLITVLLSDIAMIICVAYSTIQVFSIVKNSDPPTYSLMGNATMNEFTETGFTLNSSHYIYAIIFDSQAILLAIIGFTLKFKIRQLQEHLEQTVHKLGPPKSAEQTKDVKITRDVIKRFMKWRWEFRALDMITVDLSILPTMFGTVLTYVVVILQIRLSEGGCKNNF